MISRSVNILKQHSFFLFGARGTGKTSLLRESLKDAMWFDLLDEELHYRLARNPNDFTQLIGSSSSKWIVIDEVQRLPGLLNLVHKELENPTNNKLFALTGSSARKLKRGAANLLGGRAFVYNLFPFTTSELTEVHWTLEDYIRWGSLPRVISLTSDEERELFLRSYIDIYLREEITAEQLVRNIVPFRRCLELAAQLNGEPINYVKIARDVGVQDTTIKNYLSILEDTLVGHYLPPFDRSIRKQQLQAPKFYLFDTGIKRLLSNESEKFVLPGGAGFGKSFEHLVLLEIIRQNSYKSNPYKLSYLRTKDDLEIDLVISKPSEPPLFVEIKSSANISSVDLTSLSRFTHSVANAQAVVLCRESAPLEMDGIKVLPWKEGIVEILR